MEGYLNNASKQLKKVLDFYDGSSVGAGSSYAFKCTSDFMGSLFGCWPVAIHSQNVI